ncbi:MAG: thiamine-phosphate pyrophosphorylase [Elusimicrobia bacterium]|jgi:thiamine-phosphate pyrophosphorylase|nr:thiamine-phosphate pyrophosphorylase [Elusimicrobiota bacterium]
MVKIDNKLLKKYAIIDANINRVGEGLRVVEDWARFYIRDSQATEEIRKIRHSLWNTVKEYYPKIIKGRETGEDILSDTREGRRSKMSDIPKASFNRVKEGLRVLEEMGKVIPGDSAMQFKKMRFKIYESEREFYERDN